MDERQSLRSEIADAGFSYVRSLVDLDCLKHLTAEADRALSALEAKIPGRNNYWTPLLGEDTRVTSSLFMSERFVTIARSAIGRDVFGVMADAYASYGHSDLHSDAQSHALAGIRINVYTEPLDANTGALRFLHRSHIQSNWHRMKTGQLKEAEFLCQSRTVDPGDAAIFDLRTWHSVSDTNRCRKFVSFFYYAYPETDEEVAAIRQSAERNNRAPRYFLGETEELYSAAARETLPESWNEALKRYGFIN